jgi:hypothetical protein
MQHLFDNFSTNMKRIFHRVARFFGCIATLAQGGCAKGKCVVSAGSRGWLWTLQTRAIRVEQAGAEQHVGHEFACGEAAASKALPHSFVNDFVGWNAKCRAWMRRAQEVFATSMIC